MNRRHVIHTIDSHTGGEPTRLVIAGIPVKGRSLIEQREYVRTNLDDLRAALMREPRGHRGMFGAILCPPTTADVDFGIIWIDHDGSYLNMCGHGTIGIGKVAVECGIVPMVEPKTEFSIDMPAGIVRVASVIENGTVRSTAITNVPSFVYRRDIPIDVPGFGRVEADIAFGGSFFGAVHGDQLGIDVRSENTGDLVRAGLAVRKALNEAVDVRHPTKDHIRSVDLVTIYGPPLAKGAKYKNIHVFSDGSFDRSPGGTGTSHMMALLIDRGEMAPEEEIISEGISGSTFRGRMLERTKVGDFDAFVPEIEGSAHLTGFHQFVVEPDDYLTRGLDLETSGSTK